MQFFTSAIDTLQTLVVALGAGLGVWGVVNLLEGYGSDNPGSKSQGIQGLVIAFAVSPFGLPAVAEWLIDKLDSLNYSLKSFITG